MSADSRALGPAPPTHRRLREAVTAKSALNSSSGHGTGWFRPGALTGWWANSRQLLTKSPEQPTKCRLSLSLSLSLARSGLARAFLPWLLLPAHLPRALFLPSTRTRDPAISASITLGDQEDQHYAPIPATRSFLQLLWLFSDGEALLRKLISFFGDVTISYTILIVQVFLQHSVSFMKAELSICSLRERCPSNVLKVLQSFASHSNQHLHSEV